MRRWINKLEAKHGNRAIRDLTRYMVGIYTFGAMIAMLSGFGILPQNLYYDYLCLDIGAVLHGQVWRLFTFLLEPSGFNAGGFGAGFFINIIFFLIQISLFFMFGRSLEQTWGSFKFNVYIFTGYLLSIIAAILLFVCSGGSSPYYGGFEYIYWAMFFAFALISPDTELMLYFVIPIKVKWLAIIDAIYMIYQIFANMRAAVLYLSNGQSANGFYYLGMAISIVVGLLNFLIFFYMTKDSRISGYRNIKQKYSAKNRKRRAEFKSNVSARRGIVHKCAICGRTSEEFPELEFRYCSKCNGNYEYCQEHLFTHQHVK